MHHVKTITTALSLVTVLCLTTALSADTIIFADDFENPPHNTGVLNDNGWTTAVTSADQTVTVVNSQQSDFGPSGDSQAVLLDDNDTSGSLGDASFSRGLAGVPTDSPLRFEFDFNVIAGNQQPVLELRSGNDVAIEVDLRRFGGEMGYRDASGSVVQLGSVNNVYGQWYRVTVSIDPLDQSDDTYDLRIQSFDGSFDESASGIDFFNDVASIDNVLSRTLITAGSSGTEYAVDNVSVVAIPAPAALPAGIAMLGLIAMRRRRNA